MPRITKIKPEGSKREQKGSFKPEMEQSETISYINEIIAASNYILKHCTCKDANIHEFADRITKNGWLVKEHLQGSLMEMVKQLPEGYGPLDISSLFEKAIQPYKSESLNISRLYRYSGVFISHEIMMSELTGNLVWGFFAHILGDSAEVRILTDSWEDKGIQLRIESPGTDLPVGVGCPILGSAYFENDQALIKVAEIATELEGSAEYDAMRRPTASITVLIPHPFAN